MREKAVEQKFIRKAAAIGGVALKFVSPGRAGVPDRIVLLPVPEEHRAIVARYVWFAEIKRPGGVLRPLQRRFIEYLRSMGFFAAVVECSFDVDKAFEDVDIWTGPASG